MNNLLLKKLQVKPGFNVTVLNAPINFNEIIGDKPEEVTFSLDPSFARNESYAALLVFAVTKADMINALNLAHQNITDKTICWIIYPKAKTKLTSDLNLMKSWEELGQYNLVPCASAAINELWTALRIKPIDAQKKSGVGNAEIQTSDYNKYVDVINKIVTLPEDLKLALSAHAPSLSFYESLSYSNRKEYVLWILTAKQEKTRIDRIQKTIEKLLTGKKNPSEK